MCYYVQVGHLQGGPIKTVYFSIVMFTTTQDTIFAKIFRQFIRLQIRCNFYAVVRIFIVN